MFMILKYTATSLLAMSRRCAKNGISQSSSLAFDDDDGPRFLFSKLIAELLQLCFGGE